MALSPWQRRKKRVEHQAKVLQDRTQEPRRSGNSPSVNTTSAQFQVALESDQSRLKSITSHAQRDVLKGTELLPRYKEYLDEVIASGQGGQNDVLVQNIIWALDCGPDHFDRAYQLAEYAIKHNMATPDNFKRNVLNVLAGQIAEWCIEQLKLNKSPEPHATRIYEYIKNGGRDVVDQITAQLQRCNAERLKTDNPALALEHAETAYMLDKGVGIVPLLKSLQKQVEADEATKTEGDTTV